MVTILARTSNGVQRLCQPADLGLPARGRRRLPQLSVSRASARRAGIALALLSVKAAPRGEAPRNMPRRRSLEQVGPYGSSRCRAVGALSSWWRRLRSSSRASARSARTLGPPIPAQPNGLGRVESFQQGTAPRSAASPFARRRGIGVHGRDRRLHLVGAHLAPAPTLSISWVPSRISSRFHVVRPAPPAHKLAVAGCERSAATREQHQREQAIHFRWSAGSRGACGQPDRFAGQVDARELTPVLAV